MTTVKDALKPRFRAQSKEFYLLLGLTALITFLGLVMVASASSVDAFKNTANAASTVIRQGAFGIIGAVALVIASNLPLSLYKRFSLIFLWFTLGLQLLTVLFGVEINGNRNWLDLGFTGIQPSEFLKLGLLIAFSLQLAQITGDFEIDKPVWFRVFAYSGIALVLVVYFGKDMGTGVVMVIMLMALFLFAGMKLSLIHISEPTRPY